MANGGRTDAETVQNWSEGSTGRGTKRPHGAFTRKDCFITSTDGERALIYPMTVWDEFQGRLSRVPSTSVAKQKLLERVNYFGQAGQIDAQGRVLIPTVLRDVARIQDDVVVIGNQDHLIVWNEERIQKRLSESPMTDEDFKELELHGV